MKYYKKKILRTVGLLAICSLFCCFTIKTDQIEEEKKETPSQYTNVLAAPYIPEKLSFAGEKVPIETYWVRENLDKELIIITYQHSKTIQTIKKRPRFFPVIEKILKEEGIPDDFKYLCVAESNLENVVSPAKAAGYWQFLESTAKNYGLTVNEEVDERYDLEKSTRAACRYLKNSKDNLGSWALAAAAYNMGENGVKKNMEKQQTNHYWDLYLNQETARYLYRILAYKLLFEQPEKYGVKLYHADLYYPVPVKIYPVTAPIYDLYQFAKDQGISYLELKQLNPWLRNSKLTINYSKYRVFLPEKPKATNATLLKSVDNPYSLLEK